MEQIFLFLDIDGVVNTSLEYSRSKFLGKYQGRDLFGSPSPLAKSFLHAVDKANHIKPFWMSSGWQLNSNIWNCWAGISPWSIGYPISSDKIRSVIEKYQRQFALNEIDDTKTIAVLSHSENAQKIVWIEDGFPESAIIWVKSDRRTILIDTIHSSDASLLGIQAWNIGAIEQVLGITLEPL